MTIGISGSAGFIGAVLLRTLQASGASLRLLSRHPKANTDQHTYFAADLTDASSPLDGVFEGVDVFYHCAGQLSDESTMRALHVDGTLRLLDELTAHFRRNQTPLHWVQLSSVGVYGGLSNATKAVQITESSPLQPVGEYEVTKAESDQLIVQFASTEPLFSYSILRPSNVIGPTMSNGSIRALITMIEKKLFFYIGARDAIATYVHVDDVVDALMLCGTDERARGQVFNLSNDCSFADIVNAVATHAGIKPPTLCIPELPLRALVAVLSLVIKVPLTQDRINALINKASYPTDKLDAVLGFTPRRSIPSSIPVMFDR